MIKLIHINTGVERYYGYYYYFFISAIYKQTKPLIF